MDEPVDKVVELMSLKSSDEILRMISDIGRIIVKGYDTGRPHDVVVSALKTHFASCGKITDVYIGTDYHMENALASRAYIYILGKGAVDKALGLDGSEVEGWKISVKDFPFPERANNMATLSVKGYDTSLSENDVESALIELCSPYGEIDDVIISDGSALVDIYGEDAAVKAPVELSGSLMAGRKVIVKLASRLGKSTRHNGPTKGGCRCGRHCPGLKAEMIAE